MAGSECVVSFLVFIIIILISFCVVFIEDCSVLSNDISNGKYSDEYTNSCKYTSFFSTINIKLMVYFSIVAFLLILLFVYHFYYNKKYEYFFIFFMISCMSIIFFTMIYANINKKMYIKEYNCNEKEIIYKYKLNQKDGTYIKSNGEHSYVMSDIQKDCKLMSAIGLTLLFINLVIYIIFLLHSFPKASNTKTLTISTKQVDKNQNA